MSSLACNSVLYKPEHNGRRDPMTLNFEGIEMQKWNIPTDRVQRWMKKNGVICIVFMLTPGVTVIKMSKMARFCISCKRLQKIGHSLGKIFKCIWKTLFSSFRKCYGLLDSELSLAWFQPLKIQVFGIFYWLSCFFYISTLDSSLTVTLKLINHTIFWKKSRRSFRCTKTFCKRVRSLAVSDLRSETKGSRFKSGC